VLASSANTFTFSSFSSLLYIASPNPFSSWLEMENYLLKEHLINRNIFVSILKPNKEERLTLSMATLASLCHST
jgi:hypothetical protein